MPESKKPRLGMTIDHTIEERLHRVRVAGRRIRSASDVAREALVLGLDAMERASTGSEGGFAPSTAAGSPS